MALKDKWVDKVDGEDIASAEHINQVAHAIIELEEHGFGEDGRGIKSIVRTSGTGAAGTTDTYTITYTDNTTSTFSVYNGKDGAKGDTGKTSYQYAQEGGYTGAEAEFAKDMAEVPKLSEEIIDNESRISRNDKRITNLEQGLMADAFETDASVAYVKDVPANALPYAEVVEIGGLTRKCTNLADIRDWLHPDSGTINADGSLTFTTSSSDNLVKLYTGAFPSGKYTVSNISGLTLFIQLAQDDYSNSVAVGASKSFTYDGTSYLCFVYNVQEANTTVTYKVMLNSGDTALPYEPYFEGLRSAKVESVESVGANLFDKSKITTGYRIGESGDPYVEPSFFYSDAIPVNEGETYAFAAVDWYNFYANDSVPSSANSIEGPKSGATHIVPTGAKYVRVSARPAKLDLVMVNKGTTAPPYTPYVKHTLPIPEAVRPLHGINENVYDSIEWGEDGKQRKRVKCGVADLGTLEWVLNDDNVFQTRSLGTWGKEALCSIYDFVGATIGNADAYSRGDKTMSYYSGDKRLYVRDDDYTDAASFKAAMSGVMLYYELATPTTEDISDILGADNYIGVEGGGTLTFKNEYEYDVPSEVTYQIKETTI